MNFNHTVSDYTAFGLLFDTFHASMQTALPAWVEEYDPEKKTASVRPVFTDYYLLDDGTSEKLDYPVIPNVPVLFPRGGKWSMTFPLKQGDPVLLVCSQRSLDEWFASDGKTQVSPADLRMMDVSDAICIPGLFPERNAKGKADAENLYISHEEEKTILKLTPDGKFNLIGSRLNIGAESASTALAKGSTSDSNFTALQVKVDAIGALLGVPPLGALPGVSSGKAFTND